MLLFSYQYITRKMVDVILAFCNLAIKDDQIERFLLMLPLLHLFRQDVKPYEPVQVKNHFDRQWWGVEGLKLDNAYFYRCNR